MTNWNDFSPIDSGAQKAGHIDWNQFEPIKPDDSSDMGRGVKESFQQLPQLGWGLVAGAGAAGEAAFGEGGIATGMKKAGVEGYQRWSDKIASQGKESDSWNYSYDQAKEGNFGALVDWFQHGLGYVAGQGAQALMSAGIGAVAGKFVAGTAAKQIAAGMVAKETARLAAAEGAGALTAEQIAQQATRNVAQKFGGMGANAAMGGMAFGQEGGEIFGDLTQEAQAQGRQLTGAELGKAFVASLGAGALEFVGDKFGLDIALGKSRLLKPAEGMAGIGGRLARGGIAAAGAAPIEGGTEFAQTMLEEYGKGKDPFSPESMAQARDAAALGVLGGSAIGSAGGMLRGQKIAQAELPPQDLPKALGYSPDPYISFPDGTVGKREDVDRYVNSLPIDQQVEARAKLLGMAPQPRDPLLPILAAENIDDAVAAFQASIDSSIRHDALAVNTANLLPELMGGRTLERDLGNITLDAEQARAETQKAADLETIQQAAAAQNLTAEGAPERARALEAAGVAPAPTAMQAALHRAMERRQVAVSNASTTPGAGAGISVPQVAGGSRVDSANAATVEPREVPRTPGMIPMSLAKAQEIAVRTSGEAVAIRNQSGKLAYTVLKPQAAAPLVTKDGFPYGTRAGAQARATRDGGEVIQVAGGFAVKPIQEQASESIANAPVAAGLAPDAGAVGDTDIGRGGGSVGQLPADAGQQRLGAAEAPVRSGEPAAPVGVGGEQNATLTDETVPPDELVPPHELRDTGKSSQLAADMAKSGWRGRPVLVWDDGGKMRALTGSHRIVAAQKAGIGVPVLRVDPSAVKWEDPRGLFAAFGEVAGTGDDRIETFLRKAGDLRAASLMRAEINANDAERKTAEPTAPLPSAAETQRPNEPAPPTLARHSGGGTDTAPAATLKERLAAKQAERPAELVALRKRESVLSSIRKCLGP